MHRLLSRRFAEQIKTFTYNQYLVLLLAFGLGTKLFFLSTLVIDLTWSRQYLFGIACSFFSVAVLFLPILFIRKHKNLIAIILATVLSLLLFIDTVYFSYYKSLPSVGILNLIGAAKDVGPSIIALLRWTYLLYFIDIILAIIFAKPIRNYIDKIKFKYDLGKSSFVVNVLAVIITLLAFTFSISLSNFSTLTDVFDKGYDTVSTSQYYGVLMAHTIDTVRYVKQETTKLSESEQKTLIDWVKQNKPTQTINDFTGIAADKNVIMIQVESLGGFVINQTVNGKEVTPNLNKLSESSYYFPNNRYMIGAGHTSDSDFVANTSYFPLDDAAIFVRFGQDNFTSLPKTLVDSGYSAYAYHGFNRNFWNRDISYQSLGYQKFYAADNYPDGVKINMGLNDGDFLSKTADYIKYQPKPSLSMLITLTAHVPFEITDLTKDLGLNTRDYPNQVGGYLENINYTDRMLGEFFAKLKAKGLYDDSLIVVYGDHTPVLPTFSAGTIAYDPDTNQGKEVPLFIKLPNQTVGETKNNQGSHIDIMPTIIDLLGVKTNQLMFGQSLFSDDEVLYRECPNQLVVFTNLGDCDSALITEKNISAMIIRYNQFNNLP